MSSKKEKKIIIVEDGFKLRFHKMLRNDIQRWKCFQKACISVNFKLLCFKHIH